MPAHHGPSDFAPSDFAPSEFAGDDGSADPALRAVLATQPDADALVAALRGKRLLVALVQVDADPDEEQHDLAGPRSGPSHHEHHHELAGPRSGPNDHDDHSHGHEHEESTYMAVVSMVNAAGEKGLLAFTGLDSLAAWQPDARPKPASAAAVAQMAIEDGAAAVVVDVMGPVRAVVPASHLPALFADDSAADDSLADESV